MALAACGDNAAGPQPGPGPDPDPIPDPTATVPAGDSLSAGYAHTCLVDADHALWCWGDNTYGQLGDGTHAASSTPKRIGGASTWQTVSAGDAHTCAVRTDGTLWCWGFNDNGRLGIGSLANQDVPIQVGTDSNWRAISVRSHTCGIRSDATLWCWGQNSDGQIGDNTTQYRSVPTQVTSESWQRVTIGSRHTCAIRSDDSLWCWGSNWASQLGTATEMESDQLVPARERSGSTWKNVVAGSNHTCGIRQDGGLYCWGLRAEDDTIAYWSKQHRIGTDDDWHEISSGLGDRYEAGVNGCGVRKDGGLWCWRTNTTEKEAHVERFGSASDWQIIRAGGTHLCGVRSGGVWCWGANDRGQLGQGNVVGGPVQVDGEWRSATAQGNSSAGVRTDGSLWRWGMYDGQFPSRSGDSNTWQRVAGGIGLKDDGSLWRTTDWVVDSSSDWQTASSSNDNCNLCGIRTDGTLWCRGTNDVGQIGDNSQTDRSEFVQVGTANDWSSVSVASYSNPQFYSCWGGHSCGLRADGSLWCWGANNAGQLGDGTTDNRLVPTAIQPGVSWQSVSVGLVHTCAIRQDGSLWCWGDNNGGRLGNVTQSSTPIPMQEVTASTWRSVSAGDYSTCAIKTDGSLSCWGSVAAGLSSSDPYRPTQIGDATDWQSISLGTWHACGLRSGGSLWCFGAAGDGQLGDNQALRADPVPVHISTN